MLQAKVSDTSPAAASLRAPPTTFSQWPPHCPIESVLGKERTDYLVQAHSDYSSSCDDLQATALRECLYVGQEQDMYTAAATSFYSTAKMVNSYRAIKHIHQNLIWSLFSAGEGAFLADHALREFLEHYNKSGVVCKILAAYLKVSSQALYTVITNPAFSWKTHAGA